MRKSIVSAVAAASALTASEPVGRSSRESRSGAGRQHARLPLIKSAVVGLGLSAVLDTGAHAQYPGGPMDPLGRGFLVAVDAAPAGAAASQCGPSAQSTVMALLKHAKQESSLRSPIERFENAPIGVRYAQWCAWILQRPWSMDLRERPGGGVPMLFVWVPLHGYWQSVSMIITRHVHTQLERVARRLRFPKLG
jgi:hypothetical protein